MNIKTKKYVVVKEDESKSTNGNIVSVIGMLAAMPLVCIGLLGQAFAGLNKEGWLSLLPLLAFILGCSGLALSFSKEKYGIQIGAGLIIASAILSLKFVSVAILENETHSTIMIMTGCVLSVIFALLDFILKQDEKLSLVSNK